MPDREKVRTGLDVCLKNIDQPDCPNDCPYLSDCSKYENRVVFQPLMRDALFLLKEQEDLGKELTNAMELIHKKNERIKKLLKEQEAVEPTFKQDTDGIFIWACGSCGAYMYHIYDGIDKAKEYAKYCRQCGRKVKWE